MARREYPGLYPYPAAGGGTLYRTLYTHSNGRQRQKRGFSSPSAAAKFRARMQVRAERGELRITRTGGGGSPARSSRGAAATAPTDSPGLARTPLKFPSRAEPR